MRTLSTTTNTEVAKPITVPIYLIELVLSITYRFSTRGAITWNGFTWVQSGAKVDTLRTTPGGSQEGAISLQNFDNGASSFVLVDGIGDKPCRIWALYGEGPYLVGDAVQLFEGVCDSAELNLDRVVIRVASAGRLREQSPRLYWDQPCNFIPAPGRVFAWGGERYTLEARDG